MIFGKVRPSYLYAIKCPESRYSNRSSSTIGGNREMGELYTTSQVSNITRKTKCSEISCNVFQDLIIKCKDRN